MMKTVQLLMVGFLLLATSATALTPTQSATPSPTATVQECEFAPVPPSGPPGTRVTLSGTCYHIRHHRPVRIYFDRTLVVEFDGSSPDYSTELVIPYRAQPGAHTLTLDSPVATPFESAVAPFEVTGEPLPCSGDCDLDNVVNVGELVTGVNITLGAEMPESCPPFDVDANDAVAVNELVLAVDAAMRGCDAASGCHSDRECENAASCLAPDGFRGCGFCQSIESDCAGDVDCDDSEICAPVPARDCSCETVHICQPRCTAESCGENEECRPTGRCGPVSCNPEPCPAYFRCVPQEGIGSACVRQTCIFDDDCRGGYCVNHRCHETLGRCELPVP